MPLRNLLISEQQIGEELLEEILRDHVRLSEETKRVVFTPMGTALTAAGKRA